MVMGVDECFDGLDGSVNPLRADQRRQSADEPAGSAPGPLQSRAHRVAQQ